MQAERPGSKDSVGLSATALVDAIKGFIAGAGAGVLSKSSVAPVERTKILAQIERLRGTNRSIPRIALEYVHST